VRQASAASWSVVDLGSTNGTELNGERITGETPLAHGDRITVGGTTIVFGRTLP
jgi:pSer/pThr/pTyr-binding forkhead associated (FHA) protein